MTNTNEQPKRKCSVPHCNEEHSAKGYCKKHYKSFRRWGDALQSRRNAEERRRRGLLLQAKERVLANNMGKLCKAPDCDSPARIKGYCVKHDARIKRNGSLNLKITRTGIKRETCGVLDCPNPHKAHGMCYTHLDNFNRTGSPIVPQIVKLCGVRGCEKPHMAKGMCSTHYAKWKANVRDLGIIDFIEAHPENHRNNK